ncbi:MAG: hypothetical protein ACJ8FS_01680 [Sphingomicrobium sp.]
MKSFLVLAAMAMVATPLMAATPCRDVHGKFIKCPPKPAAKAKPKQCRDVKGKFIKCK